MEGHLTGEGVRAARRIVVPQEAFVTAAAQHLGTALQAALDAQGAATVALAGGTTPRPVYAALAAKTRLPWTRITVFFGDERAVPPDDPASNYRMVRQALLEPAGVPEERVHRMEAERPDLEHAADEYAARLSMPLDLVVLGVGPDGHTASLFPGSAALQERERLVVPAIGPTEPRTRLTITPPVLARARTLMVLVKGTTKAPAVARAWDDEVTAAECPAVLARRGTWILDEAAAAMLPEG